MTSSPRGIVGRMPTNPMPFGVAELCFRGRNACPVRGCVEASPCPTHHVSVHSTRGGFTYVYDLPWRNLLWTDADDQVSVLKRSCGESANLAWGMSTRKTLSLGTSSASSSATAVCRQCRQEDLLLSQLWSRSLFSGRPMKIACGNLTASVLTKFLKRQSHVPSPILFCCGSTSCWSLSKPSCARPTVPIQSEACRRTAQVPTLYRALLALPQPSRCGRSSARRLVRTLA